MLSVCVFLSCLVSQFDCSSGVCVPLPPRATPVRSFVIQPLRHFVATRPVVYAQPLRSYVVVRPQYQVKSRAVVTYGPNGYYYRGVIRCKGCN